MKFFILSLLSISSALFGQVAVTENEPSALVEGIVNIITGDLYALEDDIVIQGAEPLRLKRSYISAKGEGRWRFFENLGAMLYPPITLLQVNEPNGTLLEYRYDFQEIKHKKKHKKKEGKLLFHPFNLSLDGQGLSNTARGKISAQTNLKNQYISMEKGAEQFTVICPNGAKRTYKAFEDQKSEKSGAGFKMYVFYKYALHLEELPNGNKVIYEWHKRDLKSIRTTDPSGKKLTPRLLFASMAKLKKNTVNPT